MRSGERNNGKNGRALEIVGNNVLTVEVSVKEIFLLFVPVLLASKCCEDAWWASTACRQRPPQRPAGWWRDAPPEHRVERKV